LYQARKLVRLWATNFWRTQKINNFQTHCSNIYPLHHLSPPQDISDIHLQHHLNRSVWWQLHPNHHLYNIFQLKLHRVLIVYHHRHKNHRCKNLHPHSLQCSFTPIIHCNYTDLSLWWDDHQVKYICFINN